MKTLSLLLMVLNFSLGMPGWGEVIQGHPGQTGVAKSDIPIVNRNNSRFSYSMWIPPSPPQEPCVQAGCCLFPIAGCLVGYQALFKKDTIKEEKETMERENLKSLPFWKRLDLGYSGGLCYTGKDLMKTSEGWDPLEFMKPIYYLYWLNSIEANLSYQITYRYSMGIGTGYMWTRLTERVRHIKGNWKNMKWDIMGFPIRVSIWDKFRENWIFKPSLCCYFIFARDFERHFVFYDSAPGGFYDKTAIVSISGIGGGIDISLTNEEAITSSLNRYITIGFRGAIAEEIKSKLPEDLKGSWEGPVAFNFSGLHIDLGVKFRLNQGRAK